MPVALRIYKNGVDITPDLQFQTTFSHECGYSVEKIIYQSVVIGTREGGLLTYLAPGFEGKLESS